MNIFSTTYDSFRKLIDNHLFEVSGYIAYTTLLSIFPFLIAVFTVAGFFGQSATMQELILKVYESMPGEVVSTINPIIQDTVGVRNPGLLTLATVAILYFNNAGIEALRTGLNTAYMLKETRPLWWRLIQNLILFIVAVSAFILSGTAIIIIPVAIEIIEKYVHFEFEFILGLNITRFVITTLIITMTLAILYKWLPNHYVRLRLCFPGAFAASIIWIICASLFSLYIQNFGRYNVLYGALGGIIITLLFLNLTAFIIMLGAQINSIVFNKLLKRKKRD